MNQAMKPFQKKSKSHEAENFHQVSKVVVKNYQKLFNIGLI
jgi:hypothetical protein